MTDNEMYELIRSFGYTTSRQTGEIVEALRARLAQPVKPDYSKAGFGQPQREWQGLTAAEQIDFINGAIGLMDVICAIEQALKEKNR